MMQDGEYEGVCFVVVLVLIVTASLLLMGCHHQAPTISPEVRSRLQEKLQEREERQDRPHVVRADVIRVADMSEEEAERIWLETGIYRGLSDDEMIHLMIIIQETQEMRRWEEDQ